MMLYLAFPWLVYLDKTLPVSWIAAKSLINAVRMRDLLDDDEYDDDDDGDGGDDDNDDDDDDDDDDAADDDDSDDIKTSHGFSPFDPTFP